MRFKKLTIKVKLVLFSTILIIITSSAFVYSNKNNRILLNIFMENQGIYHTVNDLNMGLRKSRDYLYHYLNQGDSSSLADFSRQRGEIEQYLTTLVKRSETNNEKLLTRAMVNGCTAYFNTCTKILAINKNQTDNPYRVLTEEGDKYLGYIYGYTSQYLQSALSKDGDLYSELKSTTKKQERVSLYIIFSLLLICLIFTLIFSNSIANPIKELAEISRHMAGGNLHVRKIKVKYYNEVGILTDTFNQMSENIAKLIQDLEKKGEVESLLSQEELQNARMEELLKESQFQALQSQVNPHFLFNTLNIISRAIRFESKEMGVKLIQFLAELFRYNLEYNDKYSDIGTELELVKKYLFIQEFRFRDRLSVKIHSDPECNKVIIPKLSIQPLVENALIHGLANHSHGCIRLQVKKRKENIIIRVFDNGTGITEERRREILHPSENRHTGHTTSVGIQNIINRLQIFCEGEFTLTSLPNRWTIAGIRIPCHV
jgi:two-component system, sensor histidine kinase YesM